MDKSYWKIINIFIKYTIFILFIINSISCSFMILATEDKEPDLSCIRAGVDRNDVEAILGLPINKCEISSEGNYCDYEYNYSCGVDYITLLLDDIVTLGLFEIVSTPMMIYFCGKETTISYMYDKNNKVIYSRMAIK